MFGRSDTVRSGVSAFVANHPRITTTMLTLAVLVAVQGSVAAVDPSCSTWVSQSEAGTVDIGPKND